MGPLRLLKEEILVEWRNFWNVHPLNGSNRADLGKLPKLAVEDPWPPTGGAWFLAMKFGQKVKVALWPSFGIHSRVALHQGERWLWMVKKINAEKQSVDCVHSIVAYFCHSKPKFNFSIERIEGWPFNGTSMQQWTRGSIDSLLLLSQHPLLFTLESRIEVILVLLFFVSKYVLFRRSCVTGSFQSSIHPW